MTSKPRLPESGSRELPPILPHRRVSLHDRDNFIRNLGTVIDGDPGIWPGDWWDQLPIAEPVTPSPSAKGRTPVVALAQIKMHLRIEPDQTAEDDALTTLEMAARIHTEKILRYKLDAEADGGIGENIQLAILLLVAHWYRNREAVGGDKLASLPLGYMAILYGERDYPAY